MRKTYKGFFKPKNPRKYMGDPTQIVYRSSWEKKCMIKFDQREDIIAWASEELAIRYVSPVDNKVHRYFPDFIIKIRTKDNSEKICMIEVKPDKETRPPKQANRITKRFINEAVTYAVNEAKWIAAKKFCKEKDWDFQIWSEKNMKF